MAHDDIREILRKAYQRAGASHDDELLAKSANELIYLVGYVLAKYEQGLEWARLGSSQACVTATSNAQGCV